MAESVEQQLSIQIDEKELVPDLGASITYGSTAYLTTYVKFPIPANATNLQFSLGGKGTVQNILLYSPHSAQSITVKVDSVGFQALKVAPLQETQGFTSGAPTNLYFTNANATTAFEVIGQIIGV